MLSSQLPDTQGSHKTPNAKYTRSSPPFPPYPLPPSLPSSPASPEPRRHAGHTPQTSNQRALLTQCILLGGNVVFLFLPVFTYSMPFPREENDVCVCVFLFVASATPRLKRTNFSVSPSCLLRGFCVRKVMASLLPLLD